MADSRHITRRSPIVGLALTTVAVGAASAAQISEPSEIIRLGADFDAAYDRSREAAIAARPYFKAWQQATSGIVGMPDRCYRVPEYRAYQAFSEAWNEASEIVNKLAEAIVGIQPKTMTELAIAIKAMAYLWDGDSLSCQGLFFEGVPYDLAEFAMDAARRIET